MSNVGRGPVGQVYTGKSGLPPSFQAIGTGSGLTAHGVLVAEGTSAFAATAAGSAGQVLQSGGASADPTYSTATYPSTAGTSGKVLISNGTNIVSSTPTFPNASATSGKMIQSDGTNWVASTPTYPTTAGTSGKILISNGTNIVSSTPTYPNASVTAGKVIISDGTNYVASTPTFPNASASSGKFIRSDGTNWIASTPTLPTTAGTTSTVLRSDGTNWVNTSGFKVSSADICTNTGQPAFEAVMTNVSNVTGDGTSYQVTFGSTLFDQNNNFSLVSNGFVAPVDGFYHLNVIIQFLNLTTSHTSSYVRLLINGSDYYLFSGNLGVQKDASNNFVFAGSIVVRMTAGWTAQLFINAFGSTKTVGVQNVNAYTFSGALLC